MPYWIFILLVVAACASKPRQPSSVSLPEPPKDALTLEQALVQGSEQTLAYLHQQTALQSYPGLEGRDPAAQIPASLKAVRSAASSHEKSQQQAHLRKFRPWSLAKKMTRAKDLLEDFTCEKGLESQALGYSLELDFPEATAMTTSQSLHEKVLTCETMSRNESFFRLAIFSMQRNDCPKAAEYLNKFPVSSERGVNDRLAYLKSLCPQSTAANTRNPWGGYGILLKETPQPEKTNASWYLSAKSGSEEWDRLLVSFMELNEQGRQETLKYLASKIDYEKLRSLPLSFQTSMLVMMNFAGADLSVFQTLHRYLSDHPEAVSSSVTGLLFPTRYWSEILENTKKTDPILVKALIRQESAFNPSAKSRAKAAGLMQLIYPTARHFGLKQRNQLFTPEDNIRAGSEFLAQLIEDFGSVELALAAYNAGPGMVRQWQKRYPTSNIDLFVEMIPYTETREYVRLVSRNYKVYQTILTMPQVLVQSSSAECAQRREPAND
jgi:hypothetical protein